MRQINDDVQATLIKFVVAVHAANLTSVIDT